MKLSWQEFLGKVDRLIAIIPHQKYKTVLAVGKGSIPVALSIYNTLNSGSNRLNFTYLPATHYIGRVKQEKVNLGQIEGKLEKLILLVDDLVDTGETMADVKRIVDGDIAVLFKKPWSTVTPRYFVETTTEWVIFPWNSE